MSSFFKQPTETKVWSVDFTNILNGATLSSLTSVTPSPATLTITGEIISTDTQVQFTASAGVADTTYTLTFIFVTSDSETLEDEVLVYVATTPSSTGLPQKPPTWRLEAGHRYMKGVLPDISPIGDETLGITQDDLDAAESYAWRIMLSRLISSYVISTWTNAPPIPLFEIWDLMASSYLIALVGQRKNVDDADALDTQEKWMSGANEMLCNLINPRYEADRQDLIKADGTIQFKRTNASTPKVVNITGIEFFPSSASAVDAWGRTLEGSVEQFIGEHSIMLRR